MFTAALFTTEKTQKQPKLKCPSTDGWAKKMRYVYTMGYCVCVCALGCVWCFATPRTAAHQAPLSMGFPRREYWSGLPFPSPGSLPNPGIKPRSPTLAGRFFTAEPPGKLKNFILLPNHIFSLVHMFHEVIVKHTENSELFLAFK